MTTVTAALKLAELKRLVYSLANRCLGSKISQTKQLKKYFESYDFRRRADWQRLADKLQIKVDQAFGFSDKLAAAIAQADEAKQFAQEAIASLDARESALTALATATLDRYPVLA